MAALAIAAGAVGCGLAGDTDASDRDSATRPIAGPAPDYIVSDLGDPPAAGLNGATFSITTTVANIGDAGAVASSTTRYFLSADQLIGSDFSFAGSALVPALGVGASNTQDVALAIPSGVPGGSYFVLACADRRKTVPELDDRNNCASSASAVAVSGPDLVVESLGEPPAQLEVGSTFSLTDTTRNSGTAAAALSAVGYFLSPVPARSPEARRLSVRRKAGPIGVGEASSGTVAATVPEMPPGSYYLVACADLSKTVAESNETNNCTATVGTARIGPADPCTGGMVIDQVATSDGFTQMRQASTGQLVITGSGLESVTGVTLGELAATLVSVGPTEVRADLSIGHGAVPGPRALSLTAPGGACTRTDAIELTLFVLSPTGTDDGLGTFESPLTLCAPVLAPYAEDGPAAKAGDTLLFLAGEHACSSYLAFQGVSLVGQGAGTTAASVSELELDMGYGPSPSTVRDLTLNNAFMSVRVFSGVQPSIENVISQGTLLQIDNAAYGGVMRITNYTHSGAGGILARNTWGFGAAVEISGSQFSSCDTAIQAWQQFTSVTVSDTTITDCENGLVAERGDIDATGVTITNCVNGLVCGAPGFESASIDATGLTIEGCDQAVYLGFGTPFQNRVQLVDSVLVDNRIGVGGAGDLLMTDSDIVDDESTPLATEWGINMQWGDVVVTGGTISGHSRVGIERWGYQGYTTLTGVLIEGGERGVYVHTSFDEWGYLVVHSSIVRDQTIAAVTWAPYETEAQVVDLSGSQLSALSGFAFEDTTTTGRPPFDGIRAIGTTLNGNSYAGQRFEGPISVPPDFRITSYSAIQF